jgi:hypothetical protein
MLDLDPASDEFRALLTATVYAVLTTAGPSLTFDMEAIKAHAEARVLFKQVCDLGGIHPDDITAYL